MQYALFRFSHSLLFQYTILPAEELTHYKLDCLVIESCHAEDFLQLSRRALDPTQYSGYMISFLG